MLRIVNSKNMFFIGKIDELVEVLEDLSLKYSTLQEAIDAILSS